MASEPSTVDLTNCDREPIHVPERIQPFAALLVVDPSSQRIEHRSANMDEWLDGATLGAALQDVRPRAVATALAGALSSANGLEGVPRLAYAGVVRSGKLADVTVHTYRGKLLVELEPATGDDSLDWFRRVNQATATLARQTTLPTLADELARQVRALTGYDRVMVYRFADDLSGWVFGEARRGDLAPFLDLHYPASDIPSQARRLFLLNGTRVLEDRDAVPSPMEAASAEAAPVDMSHTFCRAVSPIHLEYLANMGVRATMSLALARPGEDSLWGLVACHHYAGPKRVPFAERAACTTLASGASFLIDAMLRRERNQSDDLSAERISRVSRALANHHELLDGVRESEASLTELFPSAGFVARTPGETLRVGDVPSDEGLDSLAAFLADRPVDAVLATSRVGDTLGLDLGAGIAGLLAIPCPHVPDGWLCWFRPETAQTVSWGGEPTKAVSFGPLGDRLTPRKSFETWVEEVRGQSEPWTPEQLRSAERVRVALEDVIFRERDRLRAARTELAARTEEVESFSTMASHDLREPIRAIGNYVTFLNEDNEGELSAESAEHLERIGRLVQRMYSLIEGMLTLSRLGRTRLRTEPVAVREVVDAVLLDLRDRIERRGATVRVEDLPSTTSWESGLRTIFGNLISNALKYTDTPPVVTIGVEKAASLVRKPVPIRDDDDVFFVRDEGIGIAEEHLQSVFRMFHRLHPDGTYGEGTGVGLPIVRRVVERLGGLLWVESTVGEGATFHFTLGTLEEDR